MGEQECDWEGGVDSLGFGASGAGVGARVTVLGLVGM